MKIKNPFFIKKKNIYLSDILNVLRIKNFKKNVKINNIADLSMATANDISFFNNLKYLENLKKSKVKYVISHDKYTHKINKYCKPIIVKNVLKSVYQVTKIFYPNSMDDAIDFSVIKPDNKKFKSVKFGENVLVGENIRIGRNTLIGHNTIIESNVTIG